VTLANTEDFNGGNYSDDPIHRASKIQNTHIDMNQANEIVTKVTHGTVEDQIEWIQVGQTSPTYNFFQYEVPMFMQYSYEDNFNEYYKIAGIMVYNNFSMISI
jgi:hypothetical protein